jgi:solute carrier family 25 oxoglutarate transporter 11
LGVVTNIITAPFELVKVRSQLLQEGRRLHGYGAERGVPSIRIFYEVIDSGVGIRGLFTGFDSLLMRGLWGGSWRTYFWCYFYNSFNKDPRRAPHWSLGSSASFLGGYCAGFITNPVDIVYNRQAADALYPKGMNRNYSSFIHGLTSVHAEGAIFRGAVASGIAGGVSLSTMSYFYDYAKELVYFWFGPTQWLRPLVLVPTAYLGTALYLPFDNCKVRLHTMRALPSGEMPYAGFFDCFSKIMKYECQINKLSNIFAFHNGLSAAFTKMYVGLLIGVYTTDVAFQYNHKEGELWEGANVFVGPQKGIIPHDPDNNYNSNVWKSGDANLPISRCYLKDGTNTFTSI